jgi:hypothetical protein
VSADFELLRFEASPASATVAIVELDGRFLGPAPARVRLLVERGGRGVEVPAITSGGDSPWTASFAVALEDLADDATEFALAPGRGPLVGLPQPEVAGGPDEDRYIRLARQANELRHRLGEATIAAGEAERLRGELAAAEQRGESEAERLRGEIAAAEQRGESEAERLRGEVAAAERRVADAEETAKAARDQRDSANAAAEAARSERAALAERLRETEARANEAERDRAALRARAESADRTAAELREQLEAAEEEVRAVEARAVAAEDETRLARRDLRDTRARLEAVLREQRQPVAERRGHEVPEPGAPSDPAEGADAASDADEGADAPRDTGDGDAGTPSDTDAPGAGTERTAVLETREITPVDDDADTDAPPRAESAGATATRATRVVRIWDDPDAANVSADDEDRRRHAHEPQIRRLPQTGDDEPEANPARVGARYIEPAETHGTIFTPARIMVGVALLLLVAALIAILLGAGLV